MIGKSHFHRNSKEAFYSPGDCSAAVDSKVLRSSPPKPTHPADLPPKPSPTESLRMSAKQEKWKKHEKKQQKVSNNKQWLDSSLTRTQGLWLFSSRLQNTTSYASCLIHFRLARPGWWLVGQGEPRQKEELLRSILGFVLICRSCISPFSHKDMVYKWIHVCK